MAQQTKSRRWVAQVKTDSTHPPAGLFKKNASAIARSLASRKVSPKGPQSGISMLNYFINRAGSGLSRSRRAELERAKSLLSKRIRSRALLLWSTPRGTVAFWLALGGVFATQAVYWIAIQPINKFWLQGKSLSAAGSRFFSFDSTSRKQDRSRPPYVGNSLT
jgi:tRNA(adenine34) deaminase